MKNFLKKLLWLLLLSGITLCGAGVYLFIRWLGQEPLETRVISDTNSENLDAFVYDAFQKKKTLKERSDLPEGAESLLEAPEAPITPRQEEGHEANMLPPKLYTTQENGKNIKPLGAEEEVLQIQEWDELEAELKTVEMPRMPLDLSHGSDAASPKRTMPSSQEKHNRTAVKPKRSAAKPRQRTVDDILKYQGK